MGTLNNLKHEVFAQHVANGKKPSEAYISAGFKPNHANASRLKHRDEIRLRIEELIAIKVQPIQRTEVTKDWIVASLLAVAERAMGKTVSIKGRQISYKFDGAVANRALELLGKELGMFIDKQNVDHNIRVISATPVTEADWEAKYASGKVLHLVPNAPVEAKKDE